MKNIIPSKATDVIDIQKHIDRYFPERKPSALDDDARDFPENEIVTEEALYEMYAAIRTDIYDVLSVRTDVQSDEISGRNLTPILERAFYEGLGIDKAAAYRLAELSLIEYLNYERFDVPRLLLPLLLYRAAGDQENILFCGELAAYAGDCESIALVEPNIPAGDYQRLVRMMTYLFLHEDIDKTKPLSAENARSLLHKVKLCVPELDIACLEIVQHLCLQYFSEHHEGMQLLQAMIEGEPSTYDQSETAHVLPANEPDIDFEKLEEFYEKASQREAELGWGNDTEDEDEDDDDAPDYASLGVRYIGPSVPRDTLPVSPNRKRGEDHILLATALAYDKKKNEDYAALHDKAARRFGISFDE